MTGYLRKFATKKKCIKTYYFLIKIDNFNNDSALRQMHVDCEGVYKIVVPSYVDFQLKLTIDSDGPFLKMLLEFFEWNLVKEQEKINCCVGLAQRFVNCSKINQSKYEVTIIIIKGCYSNLNFLV